ncbi:MAG: type II toxin-antitoxin system HipA family toxin [Bermanella sp.]
MNPLIVCLHHPSHGVLEVGRLTYDKHSAYFEYLQSFLKYNLNLSPYKLAFNTQLQKGKPAPFSGLHGVFSDSLPDGWGMRLMDRAIREGHFKSDKPLAEINPVDRLAYMGNRAMGALSYKPDTGNKEHTEATPLDMAKLAEESLAVYRGSAESVANNLYIAGGSPGGARPKATIGLKSQALQHKDLHHKSTGVAALSGENDLPSDYEHWLVKFPTDTTQEAQAEGTVEYLYSIMARAGGIDFPSSQLIPAISKQAEPSLPYFACKRFDRGPNNTRIHMHTLAGLIDADFRVCDADYEHLLKVTQALTKNQADVSEAFRRMVFNILVGNRDDHTKNFSFLMHANGQWRLSPAYDITYNYGPAGEHSMSVAGKGKNIGLKEINQLAGLFSIKQSDVKGIIKHLKDAVAQWPVLANKHHIPARLQKEISGYIQQQCDRL